MSTSSPIEGIVSSKNSGDLTSTAQIEVSKPLFPNYIQTVISKMATFHVKRPFLLHAGIPYCIYDMASSTVHVQSIKACLHGLQLICRSFKSLSVILDPKVCGLIGCHCNFNIWVLFDQILFLGLFSILL